MSQKNLFGIACKTCRRRGRKCDRKLPTCMSCSLRGAECEGYVLRWVNTAVKRESLADQTPETPDHGTNVLTPDLRLPKKAKTFKVREVANSAHSQRHTSSASKTGPQIHQHVTRSDHPVVQDTTSRGFCVRTQQSWTLPTVTITAHDDLEDLVRYCTKIPR